MRCPFCFYPESKVIDSRSTDEETKIRRRRECLNCKDRFTSYEAVESRPIIVVKKDKSRQPFGRDKLLAGLLRACEKRQVPVSVLENVVDSIQAHILASTEREVSSSRIGELAMEQLKEVDEVAYVRFASVYREFKDITSFMDELNRMIKAKH